MTSTVAANYRLLLSAPRPSAWRAAWDALPWRIRMLFVYRMEGWRALSDPRFLVEAICPPLGRLVYRLDRLGAWNGAT